MRATDRHDDMVTTTARAAGAIPVTRADLPPLATTRLDAERRAATEVAVAAERRCTALDEELASRRGARERILLVLARCGAAVGSAEAERAAAGQEGAALRERLVELEVLAESPGEELAVLQQRIGELRALRERLGALVGAIVGSPLEEERRSAIGEELDATAMEMARLDLDGAAVAVHRWGEELCAGTAALDRTAGELVDRLDGLDRRWQEHGAGDPSADPAVVAAREEVLAAQEALAQLDSQGRSGALGERLRRVIEQSHAARVELEGQGRKADPAALARAHEAEADALGLVGFDSMLDYRVAMSTAGIGSLAESRRRVTSQRLEDARAELERSIENSRATHDELRRRRAETEQRARALLPEGLAGPPRTALRSMYALPEDVESARAETVAAQHELERLLREHRDQLAALATERDAIIRRRSELDDLASRAVAAIDEADSAAAAADEQLTREQARIERVERELQQAREELVTATATTARLAHRRYVGRDVEDLRDALLRVIAQRVGMVDPGSDERPSAVVVDDPLGELDPADALAVLDAVLGVDWAAPVVFVTSRRELLAGARSRRGSVDCVDGRRRVRSSRRWRRHHDHAETTAG